MKTDITGKEDVQLIVRSFYAKVLNDNLLQPIFQHTHDHNREHFLEVMDRFWMNILFYTGGYNGNPLQTHKELHKLKNLTPLHFTRWLLHFNETVDEMFEGEKANLAKQRAYALATVMQMKILNIEINPLSDSIY